MNKKISDILSLDVKERIEIAQAIWDSISGNPESFELTDAQKLALDLRLHAYQDNPSAGKSWETIKKNLQG